MKSFGNIVSLMDVKAHYKQTLISDHIMSVSFGHAIVLLPLDIPLFHFVKTFHRFSSLRHAIKTCYCYASSNHGIVKYVRAVSLRDDG